MSSRFSTRVLSVVTMFTAALLPLGFVAVSAAPAASAASVVARTGSRGSTVVIIRKVPRTTPDGI
ncbi:MAG: hypothetical protein ABI903_08365 [Actinomycetota bacterium]